MRSADLGLAVVCFLCFVIGIPANLVSLHYFFKQARTVPNYIFIAFTALDTFTSIMVLPVGKFSHKIRTSQFSDILNGVARGCEL